MSGSALFGDEAGLRAFIARLQAMLHQGEPEAALERALAARLDPRIDDAFAYPDPWSVIAQARLTDYLPNPSRMPETGASAAIEARRQITAISFDFSSPTHFGNKADANFELTPVIETSSYEDEPYPFSRKSRAQVAADAANWTNRCPWPGEQLDTDCGVQIEGLDQLYGSRERLPSWEVKRSPAEEDLFWLESAIAAIALHLVVKKQVLLEGIQDRTAILVGSNDDRPFFQAIVFTQEELRNAEVRVWSEVGLPPPEPDNEGPAAKPQPQSFDFDEFLNDTVGAFANVRQSWKKVADHKDFNPGHGVTVATVLGGLLLMRMANKRR